MKKLLNKAFFITGSDTDAGKTEISLALMEKFKRQGYQVAGMKPIACGGVQTEQGLQNDDASRILNAISPEFWNRENGNARQSQYTVVNPYIFNLPIAPNIAAKKENVPIDINLIQDKFNSIRSNADITIVEGVGGWQVPISDQKTMQDVVKALNIPVILVVGLKLGALNHSLLTYQAICQAGLNCIAWVATSLDSEMLCREENVATLAQKINSPCLGVIPYLKSPKTKIIAESLDIDLLMSDQAL